MAEEVGGIVYEVGMDYSGLLSAQREVESALNGMSGQFNRVEASVNRTERTLSSIEGTMSSLSGVAKGLLAALSVQQVGAYAQAWQDLSNKLANAVRDSVPPFETLADVTERVFDIAQKTRSGLDSTATLYARLERSTRSYGVSVEDLTRLTTIINQGFVVSGASAEEASNAVIQLAQGLASGALRGDEFNSVNEQGNRLMIALADSMGVSIGELRNMAAQGKLTTDVIVNGLLSQGDKIGQEFAKTTGTISQSLEVASNNITKFFGENATVKTGVKIFSESVISLSENLDSLGTILTVVAGFMGSRYVGALAMATSAKIADIAASRQQLVAENQTAQAAMVAANSVQRKALADKEAALSSLALAQAEYNVAKGSAAEMLALDALVAAKSRASTASLALAQAENAQAAASSRAATAASAASVGMGLARGALSLIGGPAGAAMLAGAAIFYFWQKAQQAREEALRFADSLDKVNSSMKAMNNTQLRGTIADANESIRAQKDEVADLQAEVDALSSRYRSFTPEAQAVAESLGQGADFARRQAEVSDQLAKKSRDLADAQDKLARTQDTAAEATRTLTNNMLTSMGVHDGLIEKGWSLAQVQDAVAKAFGNTADEVTRANQAAQKFNPAALKVSAPTKEADKLILSLDEQNQLLKIQDERQRAVTKARMEAAKVTDNPNQISRAGNLAGENYDLQEAEKKRKEAQRKAEQQGKRAATTAESNAQKLEKLRQESELSADSTTEMSRAQAILNAQQSLNKGATQEQIRLAGEYAAKKWDNVNALKAEAAAKKLSPETSENASYQQDLKDLKTALDGKRITQEQYNQISEQLEQQHQVKMAQISAKQAVTPQMEAAGQVDPVQALINEQTQKLALIKAYEQARVLTHDQATALMQAADTKYKTDLINAQWEIWSQQNAATQAAAAAFDAFGQTASNALTGVLTGSMSVSEALQSIGSTVLNAVINSFVQMGVEWLKSVIMGQVGMTAATAATAAQAAGIAAAMAPAAAMTSLATGGANAIPAQAGITATVGVAKAMSVAGALKNGGPAQAGAMYEVGEGNAPEIFQASDGKQYMIPGNSGRVISNKDLTGGGSGIIIYNNVTNNSSGATASSTATDNGDGSVTIETIVADIEAGGPISNAITSHTTATRRATE
ncbi:tail length tape measure protein [Klebsiella phage VLCpiS13b]|uniref:tail length tape measure protein n=1 Tax=Klebsiella phage VLCpiS13b TaxID=2874886 RepID=UPI00233F1CAC|nr:tail length tape measure protein [Klebsiella phage VLCpiS13b]UVX30627.1 tail length tape measure protein [Klebsiella phage VLCpiS13b]